MEDVVQEVKIEFTPDQHKEIDRIVNKHLTAKETESKAQLDAKDKELEEYKTKLVESEKKTAELANLNEKISKLEKAAEVFGSKVEVAKTVEVKKPDWVEEFARRRDGK